MQIRSVVVVAALGLASFAHSQQAVQWRVEDGGNGHWYSRLPVAQSRDAMIQSAAELGAHPVAISALLEQEFLNQRFPGVWVLGLYALGGAGDFAWMNGEPLDFTNWGSASCPVGPYPNNGGHPLERFVAISDLCPGRWDDYPFGQLPDPFEMLIEWSADCNGDGIVDYGQCRDGSLPDYNGNNVPDCCEAGVPCSVGNYPVLWRVEDGGNGHWYQGILFTDTSPTSWTTARTAATGIGGDLASLTSSVEANWLYDRIASRVSLWLGDFGPFVGLSQPPGAPEPGGGWVWVDGTANTGSVPWCGNQPDNYIPCGAEQVALYWTGGPWSPAPRNHLGDFPISGVCLESGERCPSAIFEWSADCNGDGIVDYGQILNGTFADTDGNGVPDECEVDPCPGDITGGGQVNGVDLAAILGAWGTDGQGKLDCDINDDGTVDAQDLAIVLGGWGNCP
jgi:hypothetical protein